MYVSKIRIINDDLIEIFRTVYLLHCLFGSNVNIFTLHYGGAILEVDGESMWRIRGDNWRCCDGKSLSIVGEVQMVDPDIFQGLIGNHKGDTVTAGRTYVEASGG